MPDLGLHQGLNALKTNVIQPLTMSFTYLLLGQYENNIFGYFMRDFCVFCLRCTCFTGLKLVGKKVMSLIVVHKCNVCNICMKM